MVNLSGALRGLGVGLSTLGQQAMEDQRLTARQEALARLNQTIRNEDADTDARRDETSYARQTPLVVARARDEAKNVTVPLHEIEAGIATAHTAQAGRIQADQQARQQSFQVALATLQHQYHMTESEASARLADALGDDNVASVQISRDGQLVTIGRNGREISHSQAGVYNPPNAGRRSPRQPGGSGSGTSPRQTLTPRNTVPAGNDSPPFPGARRAPDGHWYVTRNGRNFRVEE